MNFHEQLQEARKASGLSQEQVAVQMNMSRQGISHWENGRSLPDAETLKRLSEVLNYNFIEPASPAAVPPEPVPETNAADAANVCPEPLASPVPSVKRKPFLLYAVCILAGIVLGWGVSALTAPHNAPAGGVKHAVITMQAEQNPVIPIYLNETDIEPSWAYVINFIESSGIDFTVRKLTLIQINDDGSEAYREWFSPSQMGLKDGLIKGGSSAVFRGGLPLQDIHGIRFVLTGVDAEYNELMFEDYLSFSKVVSQ